MTTTEKNILIATYMGYDKESGLFTYYTGVTGYVYSSGQNFKYDDDWNWLISVIAQLLEDVSNMPEEDCTDEQYTKVLWCQNQIEGSIMSNDIKSAFEKVVEIIELLKEVEDGV